MQMNYENIENIVLEVEANIYCSDGRQPGDVSYNAQLNTIENMMYLRNPSTSNVYGGNY